MVITAKCSNLDDKSSVGIPNPSIYLDGMRQGPGRKIGAFSVEDSCWTISSVSGGEPQADERREALAGRPLRDDGVETRSAMKLGIDELVRSILQGRPGQAVTWH